MMISAAPLEARQITTPSSPTNRSQKREQRGLPVTMLRMAGLETAASLIGKARLADELCITVRALNYKIGADRGVSDGEIVSAALAMESAALALRERGAKLLSHARKLRDVLPDGHPGRTLG